MVVMMRQTTTALLASNWVLVNNLPDRGLDRPVLGGLVCLGQPQARRSGQRARHCSRVAPTRMWLALARSDKSAIASAGQLLML